MPEEMAVEGLAEAWLGSVCLELVKLLCRKLADNVVEYISLAQ